MIGFLIAFVFNADTFSIVRTLSSDSEARLAVAAMATDYAARNEDQEIRDHARTMVQDALENEINDTSIILGMGWDLDDLPAGWDLDDLPAGWAWLIKILGCLVTGLAISLGSSFWFDLLNKVINLRGSGKKVEKTERPPPVG